MAAGWPHKPGHAKYLISTLLTDIALQADELDAQDLNRVGDDLASSDGHRPRPEHHHVAAVDRKGRSGGCEALEERPSRAKGETNAVRGAAVRCPHGLNS